MSDNISRFEQILDRYVSAGSIEGVDRGRPLREQGIDSISMVDILADLEDTFAIEFDVEEINASMFDTAGTLWSAVTKKLQES